MSWRREDDYMGRGGNKIEDLTAHRLGSKGGVGVESCGLTRFAADLVSLRAEDY